MRRLSNLSRPTGDLRSDAIAELRWSMASEGLTADKITIMRAVRALPAVRDALASVAEVSCPKAAYDVIGAACRSLGGSLDARLLRTALGIDYDGDARNLTERRAGFAWVGDPRTIFARERKMLEVLVTTLGAPRGAPLVRHDLPPAALVRGPINRDPWTFVDLDVTYRLAGRAVRETEQVCVLRAVEDRVDRYRAIYPGDDGAGPSARLVMYEGGTVVDDTQTLRPGLHVATIMLPRALSAGDTHRLRYDIEYAGGGESEPLCAVHLTSAAELLTVRISFERGTTPDEVWRIDGASPDSGASIPAPANRLVVDRFGYVDAQFRRPPVSRLHGIAWDWPVVPRPRVHPEAGIRQRTALSAAR